MDVTATLKLAIDKINASQSKQPADLILHRGDVSHISKPAQFDTAEQIIKGAKVDRVFYVPGEHDTSIDGGALYREHFGKGTVGGGWYSFDHKGVHFMGLNNVVMLDSLGDLGPQQLEWMKKDVAGLSSSTPIVLFAHIALWMVCPQWGWGTDDGAGAVGIEAIRLSYGFERAHPSGGSKGGRQCKLPLCYVDRVSATGSGYSPSCRAKGDASRATKECVRGDHCKLRGAE